MMRRRECLAALAGGVSLAATGFANEVHAGQTCERLGQGGARCMRGFAETPELELQPCRSLAWATCLAYVLRGYGADMDTEAVLRQTETTGCSSHKIDPKADLHRFYRLAGRWHDRLGRPFMLAVENLGSVHELNPRNDEYQAMLDRLVMRPLLSGAAGHATVITQITTRTPQPGNHWREEVIVRDPCPPTNGLRALTEDELKDPAYVIGINVRPFIIQS